MRFIYHTGQTCAHCGEDLLVTDELVLVQIVIPQLAEDNQLAMPAFETAEGEYAYEPYFFHQHCWMEIDERLDELLQEEACEPVDDAYSFRVCDTCKSGLRLNEPVALVSLGEIQRSKRVPNGEGTLSFQPYESQRFYCLSCIRAVNDDIIEMWEHISYGGECIQCTYDRCWRTGSTCNCK